MQKIQANTVDEYISAFPTSTQKKLQQIRAIIQKAAPEAQECISYKMPAYKLHGPLVYFAGYQHHIGFYPTSSGIENFTADFKDYTWSKGAVQFPLDQPLPIDLIKKITRFRRQLNLEKNQPTAPFSTLGAPAQRALYALGIKTPKQLSKYSEKEVLALHGLGPSSIPKLKLILEKEGLSFKK